MAIKNPPNHDVSAVSIKLHVDGGGYGGDSGLIPNSCILDNEVGGMIKQLWNSIDNPNPKWVYTTEVRMLLLAEV